MLKLLKIGNCLHNTIKKQKNIHVKKEECYHEK